MQMLQNVFYMKKTTQQKQKFQFNTQNVWKQKIVQQNIKVKEEREIKKVK